MALPLSPAPRVSRTQIPDLLFVDPTPEAAMLATVLQGSYRLSATSSADVARQLLRRTTPALVVTELDLEGADGVEICREAKSLPSPPPVLVTTSTIERVPDALKAGCDGVLLKPFAPNLLFARIGRLLRSTGTNREWPKTHCPYCNHAGVTSFEYCSHRRAWYACLECKKVWIAKRQE